MADNVEKDKSFFSMIVLPAFQHSLTVIGLIALVYGLVQFKFEQDVPLAIRQWGIVLGIVLVVAFGIGLTLYQQYATLQDKIRQLKVHLDSAPRIESPAIREQLPPIFLEANEVFLFGLSFENLLRSHPDTVKELAEDDRRQIKFLLPDLDYLALAIDSIGLEWGQPHRFLHEIQSTLEWLGDLAVKSRAQIEIRLTRNLPTVSILMIDPQTDKGTARVSLHLYQGSSENRPFLEISREHHTQWFEHFKRRYYEQLWASATPWEPGIPGYVRRSGLLKPDINQGAT